MTKALDRKNIYALLASIFLQIPDLTFTKNVLSLKLEECRFYEVNSDISLGINLIQNYISSNRVLPLEKVQEKLAVDKKNLARNVTEKKAIKQPYEFIYTNRPSQDVREEVVSYYETVGRVINEDILNGPDYIGLELNFMAELCTEEVLALSQEHSLDTVFECAIIHLLQEEFLQDHIGNWVPSFADELINNATTDFFKGVGFLLKGYIHQECSRFGLNCQFAL
ncbi:MAG: molecular chaperone TorD family protein [Dehalobacterium sp.]